MGDGRFDVVVTDFTRRHPCQDREGVYVSFEEGFLSTGRRHPVHGFTGVGHPQREQVHRDQLTGQADRDVTEVDLGLPARQVGLWNEPTQVASAVLDADLGFAPGDVGPHNRVGDADHAVLVDEPGEDAGRGVPLLARRVQVLDQDLLNDRSERVQLRAPCRVGRAFGWPGRPKRSLHGAPPT